MDISLPLPSISTSGTISTSKFGIQVDLRKEFLTLRKSQINWGFIQAAYACSCAEDTFIAKDNISSLKIYSNQDFDSTHPKNSDLSLYFMAKRNNLLISIADYIKSNSNKDYYVANNFYEGVFLQMAPSLSKKHKFKILITLTDGRILEAETTEVELV